MDAFRLRDRIADVAADDDAGVLRHPTMQPHEVQSVMRQDRAPSGSRCGEHLRIGQALPGEAEYCEREHIVTERTEAQGDALIEVFVGEEERHQAAALPTTRLSISCRCSP